MYRVMWNSLSLNTCEGKSVYTCCEQLHLQLFEAWHNREDAIMAYKFSLSLEAFMVLHAQRNRSAGVMNEKGELEREVREYV